MSSRHLLLLPAVVFWSSLVTADDIDSRFPLGPQLRVLATDVASPDYRKLVTQEMLVTDLAAEWQRVETEDNPDSFLRRQGGREKILADPDLKRAYERRMDIRREFLDLMREGFRRYNQAAPFDRGEEAEQAGTTTHKVSGPDLEVAPVLSAAGAERQWPRFRGPTGQGMTGKSHLPVHWGAGSSNIVWRTRVPQPGNSSPVVWDERIFLTGAQPDGQARYTYCFSRLDGRLLWQRAAPPKPPEPRVRDKNGYASATPVTDGQRVIVFLGSCGLVCYDMQGTLLWNFDDMQFDTTHGTGSSPLLYRDLVIFVHDQTEGESVFLALDKLTGSIVWRGKREPAMTWSTPVVIRVGARDELVFAGAEMVKGYDPLTGRELWSLTGPTHEVVPVIVAGEGLLYSVSGRNGPTIALRPGGSGDVTSTHLVWRTVRGGPHVPSPLLLRGRIYTINDTGIATCLNSQTGKLVWQDRIRDRFSASPIEAGGLLYFPSESGMTYVLRAGDRFEIVAENDLGSPILASPAVFEDKIVLRTGDELVCIAPSEGR
jgi:outer membrane protein assembly factor BamB